jgi:lysylphosphatidylglycerol synthetase-like protein (DUF2156 family)
MVIDKELYMIVGMAIMLLLVVVFYLLLSLQEKINKENEDRLVERLAKHLEEKGGKK